MSITVKMFTQIVNELIGWMQIHAPEIDDYNDGSITKSAIEALAIQLDFSNLQIENAQAAEAILTATGIDLDLKVADYGVRRKGAIAATGVLQFTLTTPAPIGGTTIQAGTIVSTQPAFTPYDSKEYSTSTDLTIPAGQSTGSVAAVALVQGSAANQPIFAVTVLVSAPSWVLSVTNTAPFTGGADAESDVSLRARGVASFSAPANDLANSYVAAVSAVAGILAVSVAGFGDPMMTRDNGNGGKVDIYYQGVTNVQSAMETFTFAPFVNGGDYKFSPYAYAPPQQNSPRNTPVQSITSVYNVTTSAAIPPANYALIQDATVFGGSDRAQDTLHWLSTAGISSGDTLQVTFAYDAMVGVARAAAELKRGATVDLITKPASAVPVNVVVNINAKSVAAMPAVQANVEVAIIAMLATKLLNQDLLQASVVQRILAITDVQNVVVPLSLLSTGGSGVSDIMVNGAQYIVPGTVVVNVFPPLSIQ